jgi:hypothetical protein
MVAAYIGAAYWFTASTSFANPAAAFGRMWSNTFAGIAPSSVPTFVVAEFIGALLAGADSARRHRADRHRVPEDAPDQGEAARVGGCDGARRGCRWTSSANIPP